jgi:hypothetical protein
LLRFQALRLRLRARGRKQHSAYESVVQYRWHPLHGQRVTVWRRVWRADGESVLIKAPGNVSRGLPAWMLSAEICAAMSCGPPEVELSALIELRRVLDSRALDASAVDTSRLVSKEVQADEPKEAGKERTTDSSVCRAEGQQLGSKHMECGGSRAVDDGPGRAAARGNRRWGKRSRAARRSR